MQRQFMNLKQSLNTLKSRTRSQPNRPVIYSGQAPSYIGENQNIRNMNNVFRIRGPHSSNSDPLNFLKKRHNDIKKSTSVFSEENKLQEEIEQLKTMQKKYHTEADALSEQFKNYQERCLQALQRGDDKLRNFYQSMMQQCLKLIQNNERMMSLVYEQQKDLNKQLQKLQARQI